MESPLSPTGAKLLRLGGSALFREARNIAAYYMLVVRTAWHHSLSRTQDALFCAFLVVGLVAWLGQHFGYSAMIPDITGWHIAAITFGAIILSRLLLAPYWIYKGQLAEKMKGILLPSSDAIDRPPQIDIRFEKRAPYESSNAEHHHVKSTVRIGLKNSGGGSLSNCKVYIEKIVPEPPLPGGLPILLNIEPFLLRHDDPERLIDIASQWDHVDQFRFSAPIGGSFAETLSSIPSHPQRTIVIRIVASESERRATFRLRVDDTKTIHLEFISYVN